MGAQGDELVWLGAIGAAGYLLLATEAGASVVRMISPGWKPLRLPASDDGPVSTERKPDPAPAGAADVVSSIVGAVGQLGVAGIQVGSQLYQDRQKAKAKEKAETKARNASLALQAALNAAKMRYTALSDPSTREWVIHSDGVIDIWQAGRSEPYRIPAISPSTNPGVAPWRAAIAAEPVVRVLGRFIQRGARLSGPWIDWPEDPGFHPRNPWAPERDWTGAPVRLDVIRDVQQAAATPQPAGGGLLDSLGGILA